MQSTGERLANHWITKRRRSPAAIALSVSLALFAVPAVGAAETEVEAELVEGNEGPWAEGEAPQLLELEQFFRDPQHAAGRISPDGDYVALVSAHEGAMNLHLMERGEPLESARPLTEEPRSIMGFFWSRDGRHLIFVRDRDGDENLELRVIALEDAAGQDGIPESRRLAGGDGVQA